MTKPEFTTSISSRKPAVALAMAGDAKKAPTMRKMEVIASDADARTRQKTKK